MFCCASVMPVNILNQNVLRWAPEESTRVATRRRISEPLFEVPHDLKSQAFGRPRLGKFQGDSLPHTLFNYRPFPSGFKGQFSLFGAIRKVSRWTLFLLKYESYPFLFIREFLCQVIHVGRHQT
jgi:hypothetical protein